MSGVDPRENVSILHKRPKSNMAVVCAGIVRSGQEAVSEKKYVCFLLVSNVSFSKTEVKQTLGSYNYKMNKDTQKVRSY